MLEFFCLEGAITCFRLFETLIKFSLITLVTVLKLSQTNQNCIYIINGYKLIMIMENDKEIFQCILLLKKSTLNYFDFFFSKNWGFAPTNLAIPCIRAWISGAFYYYSLSFDNFYVLTGNSKFCLHVFYIIHHSH